MAPIEMIDRSGARRWLALAVGSLVLAGLLALLLVVGRAPGLSSLFTDPGFFKRALVVHVDLSLLVWFYASLAALYSLLPVRGGSGPLERVAPWLGAAGVGLLVAAAGTRSEPVLANYVPVIHHPLFLAGLVAIALGVAAAIVGPRLLPGGEADLPGGPLPEEARPGVRAAGIAFLAAIVTFAAGLKGTPTFLGPEAYYESVFWGGGHVLQVASEALMLSGWLVLLSPLVGRSPVGRGTSAVLFGLLLVPALAAPLLAIDGTATPLYRDGNTLLMRWGIFPVALAFLGLCVRALVVARREGRLPRLFSDVRLTGFVASAGLTVTGFVLGALIRGSNTMVPAHYHAAIGGVTAALMAVAYGLLEPLGLPAPGRRLARLVPIQPAIFGAGQLVFALGFGLAGSEGMARKAYAAEQHVRTLGEYVGLGAMAAGGLVAVAGGVLFLVIVGGALIRRVLLRSSPNHSRSEPWEPSRASTPSRS